MSDVYEHLAKKLDESPHGYPSTESVESQNGGLFDA